MRTAVTLACSLFLFACGAPAIQLRGDVPKAIKDDPARVRIIAKFVEWQLRLNEPLQAIIHFVPYAESAKWPELVAAQWHVEKTYPNDHSFSFTPSTYAAGLVYPGTPHLQVDPRLWAETKPPEAERDLLLDWWWQGGYYALGHELVHRALDMKGVSVYEHHCRMKRDGHLAALALFIHAAHLAPESFLERARYTEAGYVCPAEE